MVNYNNGKIYKIVCGITESVYIGSTTKETVAQRLSQHVMMYKQWVRSDKKPAKCSSYDIIKNNDFKIYLIELFPCNTKDELTSREGEVIRKYKDELNCVNKNIAGRTHKEYWIENKDKISKQRKEHYNENKEFISEKHKDYRTKNKEIISEKQKAIYTCECGSCFRKDGKARHARTTIHQTYINTKTIR